MLLNLSNHGPKMKLVYDFAKVLEEDTERVKLAQALTLDASRPRMGLRGNHGLFGSEEWWESIKNERIKTVTHSGVIERTYFSGQDSRWGNQVNSFSLRLMDGSLIEQSIYAAKKNDRGLFVVGAMILMISALDELKSQPAIDEGTNYSKVVLEVAISVEKLDR
ncbi:hypothetical protein [Massilia sp. BJB1822]|uniref:hypothetical protein n=1 Tax=Massilia sp. BJB1822 TaxID=2744470 RepID=UPI0015948A60|nr:hypothetical protein [Massilia sp. BJB1822]NVE01882.1 hypothetical protein [Massilia sp. BJB1822]